MSFSHYQTHDSNMHSTLICGALGSLDNATAAGQASVYIRLFNCTVKLNLLPYNIRIVTIDLHCKEAFVHGCGDIISRLNCVPDLWHAQIQVYTVKHSDH